MDQLHPKALIAMTPITITSIQRGEVSTYRSGARTWTSAIVKRPVLEQVAIEELGVSGDQQSDRKIHGGLSKALLCYASEHLAAWRRSLLERGISHCIAGLPFGPGALGENLTLVGATEDDVCLDDVFAIGNVRVQVSQPRQPCWKLGLRWRDPELPIRVQRSGQTGWYVRVLTPGVAKAGDKLLLLNRAEPHWSIRAVNRCLHERGVAAEELRALAAVASIPERWRARLLRKATGETFSDAARLLGDSECCKDAGKPEQA